ncbi:MAG: transglycosylase SLT domain-containing protein [Myxococcota bacterium]
MPIEKLDAPAQSAWPASSDPELSPEKVALRREYIQARAAFARGDFAEARPAFQSLLERYPAMKDYLLRDLGRMLILDDAEPDAPMTAEVAVAVLGYGDQLLAHPGTILIGWGHYLRGRALHALNRLEEAETAYSMALAAENGPSKGIIYYYYGEICEAAGRRGDAYVHFVFAEQLATGTLKSKANAAATRVGVGLEPAERGIDWYLRRDELARLVRKGADRDALKLIQDARRNCNIPEVQTDLKRLEGYCYLKLARHDEAEQLLVSLMDEEVSGGRPNWQTIEALQKEMGKRGDAASRLSLLKRFTASHPTDEGIQAFFIMASLLKDEGKIAEAESLYQQVVDLYPSRSEANEAAWLLAWARIRRDEHGPAIEALRGIVERLQDGSEEDARARYWLARMYVLVGEKSKGESLFQQVAREFIGTYYGAMADWRLQGGYPRTVVSTEAQVRFLEAPELSHEPALMAARLLFPGWSEQLALISAPGPASHLDKAKELWLMQNMTDAINELQSAIKHPDADAQTRWMAAALRHCMGNILSAIWYGHNFLSKPMQPEDSTPQRRALAFPMPYREAIVKHALSRGLDPAVVAALIQQESTFRATIKSPVGATGLMQIMPYTGKDVARWLDITGYSPSYLTEPDFNLRLGTEYLRAMLALHNGSLVRTFASYNAGPAAVSRWVKRFGELEDDYLAEEIPYKETRTYVRRVIRNYHGYRDTYRLQLAQNQATSLLPSLATTGQAEPAPERLGHATTALDEVLLAEPERVELQEASAAELGSVERSDPAQQEHASLSSLPIPFPGVAGVRDGRSTLTVTQPERGAAHGGVHPATGNHPEQENIAHP